MLFSSFRPDLVVSKVEEQYRKELGPASTLTATAELDPGFRDFMTLFPTGGSPPVGDLFSIGVAVTKPREMAATLYVRKTPLGVVMADRTLYCAPIAKRAGGDVTLDTRPVFEGDPDAAARLNSVKGLARQVLGFARTTLRYSSIMVTLPRYVKISPTGTGALVVIQSMPVIKWAGLKVTQEAQVFLEIVARIEDAL